MEFEEYHQPSKSALKRAAKEIESLAGQLAEVTEAVVAGLKLPTDLQEEVDLVRRTKGHGAHKRQVKHLAALLRERPEETAAISGASGRPERAPLAGAAGLSPPRGLARPALRSGERRGGFGGIEGALPRARPP